MRLPLDLESVRLLRDAAAQPLCDMLDGLEATIHRHGGVTVGIRRARGVSFHLLTCAGFGVGRGWLQGDWERVARVRGVSWRASDSRW